MGITVCGCDICYDIYGVNILTMKAYVYNNCIVFMFMYYIETKLFKSSPL